MAREVERGREREPETYVGEGFEAAVSEGLEGTVGGVWIGRPEKPVLSEGVDGVEDGITLVIGGGVAFLDALELLSEGVRIVGSGGSGGDVQRDAIWKGPIDDLYDISGHGILNVVGVGDPPKIFMDDVSEGTGTWASGKEVAAVGFDDGGLDGDGGDDGGPIATLVLRLDVPRETGHDEKPLADAYGGALFAIERFV